MAFGPPMDRRKVLGLVAGTRWDGVLELNRMAFSDRLPRNSESRAMAVAFRMIQKRAPQVEWVLSYSDASQCGDGTIYRAAGFVLTGIKPNRQIYRFPNGAIKSRAFLTDTKNPGKFAFAREVGASATATASMAPWVTAGATLVPGFQLRYIRFLNPAARSRLTVPELPFSAIDEAGARMYRGKAPEAGDDRDHRHSDAAAAIRGL